MLNDFASTMRDFATWYEQYNVNKKNQQDFGIKNVPARIFRRTINMTTAAVLPVGTGTPFNGAQIEKIYDATTGLSVDGNIRINLDRAMIDSNTTYKKLVEQDSFLTGTSVANAFLSWDAQPNVKVDIIFFNDIEFRSGSQKTTVSGTVSVANTNATAIYQKIAVPTSIQRYYRSNSGTDSYAIPAGYCGIVRFQLTYTASTNQYIISIGGTNVYEAGTLGLAAGNTFISPQYYAAAGETVSLNNVSAAYSSMQIEVYPI